MQRIDAHQHFWKFDPERDNWISEEMSVIRKDFMPQDLKLLLQQNGFDGCVAVQADQSEEETNFLLELAKEHEFIKGVVGWIDLRAENIEERLIQYQQFDRLKGFRHILQGEKDRALMLQPEFKRGIAALKAFGFTYDVLIYPDQLAYTKELVATFPEQKFVVDHLAKPDIKSPITEGWKKYIQELAQYDNVWCKVSGMVTEADWKNWEKEDFNFALDVVTSAFGTQRLMYGSDWPVCLLAASYQDVVNIVKDYFSTFSTIEKDQVFGANAIEFYNLL